LAPAVGNWQCPKQRGARLPPPRIDKPAGLADIARMSRINPVFRRQTQGSLLIS